MRSRSRTTLLTLCLVLLAPLAFAQELPSSADEALDPLRERFRAGLDKYRAGAFAEAILIWENVYRELGPEKGYRLSFNLARAYEQFGDSSRAAESYDAYVEHTTRRRLAGEALEPIVEKQEVEARARLAELAATQGRIRIAGDRGVVVKIDGGAERIAPRTGFVAYVTPGKSHVVTFNPGTKDEEQVELRVELGQLVELSPPPPKEVVSVPPPVAAEVREPRSAPARLEVREDRPYDKSVLYVAAGVTALSFVVPIVLHVNGSDIGSDYDAAKAAAERSRSAADRVGYDAAKASGDRLASDYESARSTAQASFAIPALLGAATLGLTAYWLFGARTKRVTVTGAALPSGATLGASARF